MTWMSVSSSVFYGLASSLRHCSSFIAKFQSLSSLCLFGLSYPLDKFWKWVLVACVLLLYWWFLSCTTHTASNDWVIDHAQWIRNSVGGRLQLLWDNLSIWLARLTTFRVVFWVILPCKMIVDRRFRGAYCLHHQGWVKTTLNIILAAVRTWNLTRLTTFKKQHLKLSQNFNPRQSVTDALGHKGFMDLLLCQCLCGRGPSRRFCSVCWPCL
jgi:hypothetical protein